MSKKIVLAFLISATCSLYASTGAEISKDFNISGANKVAEIWIRIFDSKKYKRIFPRSERDKYLPDFKKLSEHDIEKLKNYLIEHAADSAKPKLAGEL